MDITLDEIRKQRCKERTKQFVLDSLFGLSLWMVTIPLLYWILVV